VVALAEKKTWCRRPDIYEWPKFMQHLGKNRACKYFSGDKWLFTHNLGSLSLIADAWIDQQSKDDGVELVEIRILDINTVLYIFSDIAVGYASVTSVIDQQGSGRILEQTVLSSNWVLQHNLGTIGTISDIWSKDPLAKMISYSTDHDFVYVEWDRDTVGAVVMVLVDNSADPDMYVTWQQISGKPAEYPPTAHTHQGVDIESTVDDSNHLGGVSHTQYLQIKNIGKDIPPLDSVTKKIPIQYLPSAMQLQVGTTEKDYTGKYFPPDVVPTIRFGYPLFTTEINADGEAEIHIKEYVHSIQLYGNIPPGMAADVRPDKNNNRIQFKAGAGIGMKCDPATPSLLELYSLDATSLFWKFNRELQPKEFWEIENPAFSLDVSKALFNVYAYVPQGLERYEWRPQVTATTLSEYFDVISSSRPVDEFLTISKGRIQYKVHGHQGYTVKTLHSDTPVTIPSSTKNIFDVYVNSTDIYYVGKNSLNNLQVLNLTSNTTDNTLIDNVQYAYFEYPNIVYIKRDNVTFDLLVYEYNIITKTTTHRSTIQAFQLGLTSTSYVYYYREFEENGITYAYIGEKQTSSIYKVQLSSSLVHDIYNVPPSLTLNTTNYIKLPNDKWAVLNNNVLYGVGDIDDLQNLVSSNTIYDNNCLGIYCPTFDNTYFLTNTGKLVNFTWEDKLQIVYETGSAILQMKDTSHTSYKVPKFLHTVHDPMWTGEGNIKVGIFDFLHPNSIHTVQSGAVAYIAPTDVDTQGMPLNTYNTPIMFNSRKSLGIVISLTSNDSATCPYINLSPELHGFLGERYVLNPPEIQVSIFDSFCVLYNTSDTPIGPIVLVKR
jgi:hypothetical protein